MLTFDDILSILQCSYALLDNLDMNITRKVENPLLLKTPESFTLYINIVSTLRRKNISEEENNYLKK